MLIVSKISPGYKRLCFDSCSWVPIAYRFLSSSFVLILPITGHPNSDSISLLKVILYGVVFSFLPFWNSDWNGKLLPTSQRIEYKMKSNRDLFTRVLPRFRQFSCFSFELELVPSDIFLCFDGPQ